MLTQLPRVPSLIPSSLATRAIGREVSITIFTASSRNSGEKLFFGRGNYFTFPDIHPNGWTVRKPRGTPLSGPVDPGEKQRIRQRKRHRNSSRWQRRPGEEDSYRAVTNRRSAARLPVASPCPRENRGRWCHEGRFPATGTDRHPGLRRVPTSGTVSVPIRKRVP